MKTLSLLLFLSIAVTAFGQQRVTGSNVITLDQAIRLALDSNYSARIASNELVAADYSNLKAKDNLLPTASATGSYEYDHSLSSRFRSGFTVDTSGGFQTVNTLDNPNSHSLSYGITGNLNIYNGGFDAASIRAAGYGLDAAKYNFKWVRQQTAYNVSSAYINALRTKELVATNTQTLAEDTSQLGRLRGLYSAGSIPIGQVYQQQAVVSQQQVQLIQARNNYLNAKADLLFLLNIAPDAYENYDISLAGIDTSFTTLSTKEVTVQPTPSIVSSVLNQREDLLALRSTILSDEASIDVTRSSLFPKLGLRVGLTGSGNNVAFDGIQLFHLFNAGLSLGIPIYDAGQNRLQIDIQEVNLETSKVQLQQSEQQFRSDIAKAQNNLNASREAVEATATEILAAEESLRSAAERLRVGAGIQVDVIVAESQVLTARTDRVNAVYNYLLATKQLEYLLGKTNY